MNDRSLENVSEPIICLVRVSVAMWRKSGVRCPSIIMRCCLHYCLHVYLIKTRATFGSLRCPAQRLPRRQSPLTTSESPSEQANA